MSSAWTRLPKARALVGRQLVAVERLDHTWFFRFTAEATLATESLWRVGDEARILVGSEDHGQHFGLPQPVDAAERASEDLEGRSVEAAVISSASGDLTVEFSGQRYLQLLQVSSGYESWRLTVDGNEVLCTGGGELAILPRH